MQVELMIAATKEHVCTVEQSKWNQRNQSFHSMNMLIIYPSLYIISSESNFTDVILALLEAKGIQLLHKSQLLPPFFTIHGVLACRLVSTLCSWPSAWRQSKPQRHTDVPSRRRCTTLTDSVFCWSSHPLPWNHGKLTKTQPGKMRGRGNFESCSYPSGHITLLYISGVFVCVYVWTLLSLKPSLETAQLTKSIKAKVPHQTNHTPDTLAESLHPKSFPGRWHQCSLLPLMRWQTGQKDTSST